MRIKKLPPQKIIGEKETDFYVPERVIIQENNKIRHDLFYYEWYDPDSSLVEMSINSDTNKITEVTLVTVNDIKDIQNMRLDCPKVYGNPIIDMDIFKEKHNITEYTNFDVYIDEKKIYVIQENVVVCKQVILSFVRLLLDEKRNIVGFIFEGFSDDEWEEVMEGINMSIRTKGLKQKGTRISGN